MGSAPHQPSTAAAARTTVTRHKVIVCTVPTARAEPAIPSAKSHRLAWGIQGGRRSVEPVVMENGGGYPVMSVAAEGPGVRGERLELDRPPCPGQAPDTLRTGFGHRPHLPTARIFTTPPCGTTPAPSAWL